MNGCFDRATWIAAVLLGTWVATWVRAEDLPASRLPDNVPPVIGCWFWHDEEFTPGGYRPFVDLMSKHSAFNLLTTSLRAPNKEVTDASVHDRLKDAAIYAREHGMKIVLDLDVRLARAAFQKKYPDELQEMLRLREVDLRESGEASLAIASDTLSDHYTFRATPYIPLSGRLVRVYSYVRGPEGIEPGTLEDITASRCRVRAAGAKEVSVAISCDAQTNGRKACVMVAFTHFTPDVFAPHLLDFQRSVYRQYADVLLAGVCKDEWGFPPCFDGCPAKNDYWFSQPMAAEYARRTGGRDLVKDCLLMCVGQRGRRGERQAAINHFMEMCWRRNGEIEDDSYRATKEVFGPRAVAATHPTWWPHPDTREFKKNGLDWWVATRDLAQTDEVAPYCVRTALAKKWKSPLWYNMYYSGKLPDYDRELWANALAGGRINYHPLYPFDGPRGFSNEAILGDGRMRGDCRIRLLNFIATTPLDCPVAIVFGHACAMNWAGPAYDDVGLALADRLARAGYPADLIPSDEIAAKSLVIDQDGWTRYGPQRYAAVILYHPEFERPETAAFFRRAAEGKTALYRVGDWTTGFDGEPLNGNAELPKAMKTGEEIECAAAVVERLKTNGIAPQTPATGTVGWDRPHAAPPKAGRCRLIDGTEILVSGEKDVAGDPIQSTFQVRGHSVEVDAVGVVAVRLASDGALDAFAAGGLKRLRAGGIDLALERRTDLAAWRDSQGKWQGVVQDLQGPIPAPLQAMRDQWMRLAIPLPLPK